MQKRNKKPITKQAPKALHYYLYKVEYKEGGVVVQKQLILIYTHTHTESKTTREEKREFEKERKQNIQ